MHRLKTTVMGDASLKSIMRKTAHIKLQLQLVDLIAGLVKVLEFLLKTVKV